MSYSQLIQHFGFDERLVGCAMGIPKLPLIAYRSPAQWYVYPPALVPIASNGSIPGYLGLWAHWFTNRVPTFVSMSIEDGRSVLEIARTTEQFVTLVLMLAITENDGRTDEIDSFAKAMHIDDIDALDNFSLSIGDDVSKFWQIPVFATKCPLAACADLQLYDGEFPAVNSGLVSFSDLPAMCSPFELPFDDRRRFGSLSQADNWWRVVDKQKLFDICISAKNFRGAWLTLNSPGWTVAAAGNALTQLASKSGAPGLDLLRDAWCALATGPDLTY